MNIRKMKKRLKNNDGGVIKFKDRYRRKTYYFEIDYETSFRVLRKMKKRGDFILLLASDGNHQIYKTVEDIQTNLSFDNKNKIGSIFSLDKTYGIADKELTRELFTNISIPNEFEKYSSFDTPKFLDNPFNEMTGYLGQEISNVKPKKTNSIFTVSKPVHKERFDWDEAYLEGLRIHGNIDDAECHADDEESKFKKNNR